MRSSPLLACLVVAITTSTAIADAPATFHDVYRQEVEFRRQLWITGYETVGKRNDAWDAKARSFLEASAAFRAGDSVDPFYWPQDLPTAAKLAVAAEELVTLGCDDPLVRALGSFWQLRALQDATSQRRVSGAVRPPSGPASLWNLTAVPGIAANLAASNYDTFTLAELLSEPHMQMNKTQQQRQQEEESLNLRWIAAAKPGAHTSVRQRLVARWSDRLMGGLRTVILDPRMNRLLEEHEKSLDPWVFHMLRGRHLMEQAGLTPGAKAPLMSPLEKKAYEDKLRQAATHLLKARELEPRLPQPATQMILVSSVLKEHGDPLDWFGHALEVQCDEVRAFQMLRSVLRANTEGDAMNDLARACLAQQRFDTIMPWQYMETIRKPPLVSRDPWAALHDDDIYANAIKVLDGYTTRGPQHRRAYYASMKAAVAYKTERMKECRAAMEQATAGGEKVDPHAFVLIGIPDPAWTISLIYLRTGPQWDQVEIALHQRDRRNFAEALRLAEQAVAATPKDHPQSVAVGKMLEDIQFSAGQWVALPHPMAFPLTTRFGFNAVEGQSSAIWPSQQPQPFLSFQGNAANPRKLAIWDGQAVQRQIPLDFEAELHLLFVQPDNPYKLRAQTQPAGQPASLGVVFFEPGSKYREYALVDFGKQRVGIATDEGWQSSWDAPVKAESVLTVRCVGRRVTMQLDGRPIGEEHRLGLPLAAGFQFGIGGVDPASVYVRKIRVRSLPAEDAKR